MTEEVPPDQIRVSDVDRKAVQDRLHSAHAEGLITLAEFDTRVGAAWQALNRGDLAKLTADLPAPRPVERIEPPRSAPMVIVPRRRRGNTALRVLNTIWLSITAVNLVVWAIVSVTTGQFIYPWFVWLAVPGAALGVLWVTVGGNRRELPHGD